MKNKELKYTKEFKAEVCEYALKESILETSALYGIHRNTIGRWLTKFKSSGIRGFIVKRNDTQVKKLDDIKLNEIKIFKRNHPDATLAEIKEKLNIDCDISLISRKLKKNLVKKRKPRKNDTVFLKLRTIKNAVFKNQKKSIYRLSLHSYKGELLSIGFTRIYTSENTCLFLRFSIENLIKTGYKFKIRNIICNMIFLKKKDFDSIVKSKYQIELRNSVKSKKLFDKVPDIYYERKNSISDSIEESYEKILANYNASELENMLLTSVINIDSIKTNEVNRADWETLLMPAETKSSIYGLLNRIKESGDKAALNFDYEKAKDDYNKAYMALHNMGFDVSLLISILIKKAVVFYNSRDYHVALMLFRDALKISKKNGLKKEIGDCYFYIGMSLIFFQDIDRAVKYFEKSALSLKKNKDDECVCMYYRSIYLKNYLIENFNKAEKLSNFYYKYAFKTDNKQLIGQCLSISPQYLIQLSRYSDYEIRMLEAKEYNIANGNYYEVISNISNLMYMYIDPETGIKGNIEACLSEFKYYADKMNLPSLVHHINFQVGVYYSNISELSEAEKVLSFSLPHIKKRFNKETYLMSLYSLGKIFFEKKDYTKAVRKVNLLMKESLKYNNQFYLCESYILLSKIFLERKDFRRAVGAINKTINISKELEDLNTTGEFYSLYADICIKKKMDKKALYFQSQALKCFEQAKGEKSS